MAARIRRNNPPHRTAFSVHTPVLTRMAFGPAEFVFPVFFPFVGRDGRVKRRADECERHGLFLPLNFRGFNYLQSFEVIFRMSESRSHRPYAIQ